MNEERKTKPEAENPKSKNITILVTDELRARIDALRQAQAFFSIMPLNQFTGYLVGVGLEEEETRIKEKKTRTRTRLKNTELKNDAYDEKVTYEIIRERPDEECAKIADNMRFFVRWKLNDENWGAEITGKEGPRAGHSKLIKVRYAAQEEGFDPDELQLTVSDYWKGDKAWKETRRADTSKKTSE